MADLLINTTYYARAYATNAAGTSYGNLISFTTLNGPIEIPKVTTVDAYTYALSGDSVRFGGTITNNGGSNSFT